MTSRRQVNLLVAGLSLTALAIALLVAIILPHKSAQQFFVHLLIAGLVVGVVLIGLGLVLVGIGSRRGGRSI